MVVEVVVVAAVGLHRNDSLPALSRNIQEPVSYTHLTLPTKA